jgi:chromate transporter
MSLKMDQSATSSPDISAHKLKEVARLFLKLGFTGFGGPAVHIAMMEEEVVRRRQWMDHQHFIDLIGATNLIPGPNSTEMTMHIGQERAGWKGLLVAGLCFIVPAVLITAVFAWAYQLYGHLPQVQPFIYGIQPAILAVIVALMYTLGRKALKTVELGIIGVIAAVLTIFGTNEIIVLFGAGALGMLWYAIKRKNDMAISFLPLLMLNANSLAADEQAWKMFWTFLKIGSILYGSGYVLFAFLDADLVKTGILTKQVLIDAIAVGQFTPGPVFSSATFIGWQIAGMPGAIGATIGIFLPSFLFVALLNPLIPALRKSKIMSSFLDAVNIASIAIILGICVEMGEASIVSWRTILIAVLGLIITLRFKKLNSAFVVLGGSLLGFLLTLV